MDEATVRRIKSGMEYEANRTAPPPGFPRFPAIPGGRYVDPQFLALERGLMWKRSWLYACHLDEIPSAGSYMMFRKTGSPILIVRGKDDNVRAFYNTCRHRGGPLVKDEGGRIEGFVCSYHGWTYTLDGKLINLRDRRDFVDLDLKCYSLVDVRCERLSNWVFINEDPLAVALLESLGPIPRHFQQIKPEEQRFIHKASYHVKCNVKVLLDAFLEVYHLKSIHSNTVDRFLDHRGTTISLWPGGHSLMVTPNRRPDWVDPGTRGMRSIETASEIVTKNNPSFNFYPNLVTPINDSGIPFILFWPDGDREMDIDVHWFAPDWGSGEKPASWKQRIDNFERILFEDTQFAESIQRSVESPGFKGVMLNYQERRIYHWHEELDRRIGVEIVPPELRVEPKLAGFIER